MRDQGLLGANDRQVLEYAFNHDRILVTANIVDFKRFVSSYEVHAGIVFIEEGDLLRHEQLIVINEAVKAINKELKAGRDMINRVLYISLDGRKRFEDYP